MARSSVPIESVEFAWLVSMETERSDTAADRAASMSSAISCCKERMLESSPVIWSSSDPRDASAVERPLEQNDIHAKICITQ